MTREFLSMPKPSTSAEMWGNTIHIDSPWLSQDECILLNNRYYREYAHRRAEWQEFATDLKAHYYELEQVQGSWNFRNRVLPKLIDEFSTAWQNLEKLHENIQDCLLSIALTEEQKNDNALRLLIALRRRFQAKFMVPKSKDPDEDGHYRPHLNEHFSQNELTGELKFFGGRLRSAIQAYNEYLEKIDQHLAILGFKKFCIYLIGILKSKKVFTYEDVQSLIANCTRLAELTSLNSHFEKVFHPSNWVQKGRHQITGVKPIIAAIHNNQRLRVYLLRDREDVDDLFSLLADGQPDDLYFILKQTESDLEDALGEKFDRVKTYLTSMVAHGIKIPMSCEHNLSHYVTELTQPAENEEGCTPPEAEVPPK